MIKLGFSLPQFGRLAQPTEVARFAAEAERLGAASLWVGDRLFAPVNPSVGYAGTDTLPPEFRRVLDPVTVMTIAATATTTATIGSNVLNLPWYPPALLARSLTTIDLLSGGRLLAGFGIGWSPEEYQAVGVPFSARGARLDDYLDALDVLWSESPAAHDGRFTTVPPAHVELKPGSKIPVYLGGFSEAALARVARRADGWLPAARLPGRFDAARFQAMVAAVGVPVVLRVNAARGTTLAEIADVVRTSGVSSAFVDLMYLADDVDHALELAAELLALVGG